MPNPTETTLPARSESATHPAHQHLDARTLGECYTFTHTEFAGLLGRLMSEMEGFVEAYFPDALEKPRPIEGFRRNAVRRYLHSCVSGLLAPELRACQDAMESEGLESRMYTPGMGELVAEAVMKRPVTNPHALRLRQVREEELKQRDKMGE